MPTRLHYDLRLEFDGVFKSWAVTRGPSLDPHDKRLAVEVEDHPLDYGDFEGTIPKGQYGGGTVQLWDRGYWESDDPERGFKKGDLKFTLHGEKLRGSWVLVRMRHDRNGGKRTNWLLIKHRDEFAKEGKANDVLDADKSVASGRTMDADRRGQGQGAEAVHDGEVRPRQGRRGLEFEPRRCRRSARRATATRQRRARPVAKARRSPRCRISSRRSSAFRSIVRPAAEGWCHEIKFDGYRVQLRVEDGEAVLKTRKGLDWTDKFPAIAKQADALPDALIDGEIVALDDEGMPDFSTLQAAISDGKTGQSHFLCVRSVVRGRQWIFARCRSASASSD